MKKMPKFIAMPGLQGVTKRFKCLLQTSSNLDHVLIRGPRGVGKTYFLGIFQEFYSELPSNIVHLNCAAIHPDTVESELFGHSKGAFTGANSDKSGFLEEANKKGGVIILEELNSLSKEIQSKLLVFMDHYFFYPLGSRQRKEVKVRIVCTMNFEESHGVRLDLIDRFLVRVDIPPLFERRIDILTLIDEKFSDLSISNLTILCLFAHNWPGNIRQLEQALFEYRATGEWPPDIVNNSHKDYLGEVFKRLIDAGLSEDILKRTFPIYFYEILAYLYQPFKPHILSTSREEEKRRKPNDSVLRFFKLIFGKRSITSPEHILTLEPFSNDSLLAIRAEMERIEGLNKVRDLLVNADLDLPDYLNTPSEEIDFHLEALEACKKVCMLKTVTNNSSEIKVERVAEYLIGGSENFQDAFCECFHMLGVGAQVRLSEIFGRSTTTINNWCREFGLTEKKTRKKPPINRD